MRKLIGLALLLVAAAAVAVTAEGSTRHPGRTAEASQVLPPLKRQGSPEAVVAEHLAALNACDWNRLMAQYPPEVHFFLPGGTVVIGREAVGTPQQSFQVGHTINVQWSAYASFLTEPYLGADAYVTKAGLMYAQVTTFGAPPLPYR